MESSICESCQQEILPGQWAFCPHPWTGTAAMAHKSAVFPFTTPHITADGKPITITDIAHLRKVEKEYGVVLPAFAKNEHDLDPIQNPPKYTGYEKAGNTYLGHDPDRARWEANRKSR
jgi:hypothetical protein